MNKIPGLEVDLSRVQTNIVRLNVSALHMDSFELAKKLKDNNVYTLPFSKDIVRMVTHKDISSMDIDFVIQKMNYICQ